MKILFYRYAQDPNFEAIITSINKTKHQFGYASGEVTQEAIANFAPDIIIHNIPNTEFFPIKSNAISININDTDNKHSFSFTKPESKNYIGKFVYLRDCNVNENELEKYKSDVVYIGSPVVFGNVLDFLVNNNINFKFFNHQPHNINGYCGMCSSEDYGKFYKNAKACIVTSGDDARLMDIVSCDGNPVVYNNNADQCIEQILSAINENKKYTIDGYNKEDILKQHTSFDKAAQIFKTIGLSKISEEILKIKKIDWYKK
jgi:hypothetical protein